MKTLRSLAAAGLALVLAATAHAQGGTSLGWGQPMRATNQSATNPQVQSKVAIVGGVKSTDSTGVPLQFDGASGGLKTSEQFPAQSFQLIQPSVLSTQFFHTDGVITGLAGGPFQITDSTIAPINVQGYTRLALLVFPQTLSASGAVAGSASDSILAACLALSWRLHTSGNADSANTFIELPWNRFTMRPPSNANADSSFWKPDTVGTTMIQAYNLANASGGASVAADDRIAQPGESVVCLNAMSARGLQRFPRGRLIYLKTHDGADVSGNYISLYWRALITILRTGAIATDTQEVRYRVRADLVGWR